MSVGTTRALASGGNYRARTGLFYAGVAALVIACAGKITDPDGYEPVGSAGPPVNAGGSASSMVGESGSGGMAGGSMIPAGSGGTGSGQSGGSAAVCDAGTIVNRACATGASCHGTASSQSSINSDGAALAGLRTERNSSCEKVLIDSDNPAESLILLKVQGTQPANCGGRMPPEPFYEPLDDFEIDCIAEWVTQF